MEEAIIAWDVAGMRNRWPLMDKFVEFVKDKSAINRYETTLRKTYRSSDTWKLFLSFTQAHPKDLSNYDEDACWPSGTNQMCLLLILQCWMNLWSGWINRRSEEYSVISVLCTSVLVWHWKAMNYTECFMLVPLFPLSSLWGTLLTCGSSARTSFHLRSHLENELPSNFLTLTYAVTFRDRVAHCGSLSLLLLSPPWWLVGAKYSPLWCWLSYVCCCSFFLAGTGTTSHWLWRRRTMLAWSSTCCQDWCWWLWGWWELWPFSDTFSMCCFMYPTFLFPVIFFDLHCLPLSCWWCLFLDWCRWRLPSTQLPIATTRIIHSHSFVNWTRRILGCTGCQLWWFSQSM